MTQSEFSSNTPMMLEINKANELAAGGDLVGAEAIYQDILAKHTNHPFALYGLAQLAEAIQDYETKEVLLSQAVATLLEDQLPTQQSQAAAWLTELAEVLYKLNRPDEAQQCTQQCQQIISSNLEMQAK